MIIILGWKWFDIKIDLHKAMHYANHGNEKHKHLYECASNFTLIIFNK